MKKAILVVIGLIALGAVFGGSKNSSSTNNDTGGNTPTTAVEQTNKRIGQFADDGQLRFVAQSVTCGIPSVGDLTYGAGAAAQGQFCKVQVYVKNISTKSADFFSSNQYAYDASGNQYEVSSDAQLWSNASSFLDSINPGNSTSGALFFDIPKGASIAYFEFHDSAFSGGVRVDNR